MNPDAQWLLLVVGAYLVGSIPVGLLLGKARGVDLRAHGSGNIGATNAMRVLGKRLGILCFVLDVAKGAAPTIIAGSMLGALGDRTIEAPIAWRWLAVAGAAILGHMFPIWLRLKGGKGVATGFGAMAAVWPDLTIPVLIALALWIASARLTRFVGVSSCLAAASLPASVAIEALLASDAGLKDATPFLVVMGLVAAVVVWRHRGNLRRTMAGTEPRIGEKFRDDR